MECFDKYKGVIFDFDMTLADSSAVIVDLLNDTAEHFGYPRKSYKEILPVIGNTHEIMLSYVTEVKDSLKVFEMREYYRELGRREMPSRTTFFPDVAESLAALRENGFQLGLVSLKLRDILMVSLKKYDLEKYFSVVLGCEDVPAPKPDPSGILLCMNKLGLQQSEVLYVGDSLVDEGAACNANVDFGAMLLGGTTREQFNQQHTPYFFRNWKEMHTVAMAHSDECFVV